MRAREIYEIRQTERINIWYIPSNNDKKMIYDTLIKAGDEFIIDPQYYHVTGHVTEKGINTGPINLTAKIIKFSTGSRKKVLTLMLDAPWWHEKNTVSQERINAGLASGPHISISNRSKRLRQQYKDEGRDLRHMRPDMNILKSLIGKTIHFDRITDSNAH